MKFKTLRTSETGKLLNQVVLKMAACKRAQDLVAKILGFTRYRHRNDVAYGGISCIIFDKPPSKQNWVKAQDGYLPRRKGKRNKHIANMIDSLPVVKASELCEAINLENFGEFKLPGLSFSNKEYYLLDISDDWMYNPPEDCIKISEEEYKKLSEK